VEKALRLSFPRTVLLLSFLSILLFVLPAYGANVTLGWDASSEPNLDHYVVYWGTAPGSYSNNSGPIAGDITSYKVTGLSAANTYYFAVTAVNDAGYESGIEREIFLLGTQDLDPPYDKGWGISRGDLEGFKIMFESSDPFPALTSWTVIPLLKKSEVKGVGKPLNLETYPSGMTFNTPVKVFIPCPTYSSVNSLDIYYYDDVRMDWYLANDADDPHTVQPDAVGWMVPGSRVNHNNGDPSTIQIQVYHFSGIQAASSSSSSSSSTSGSSGSSGGGGGGGGCFVATASSNSQSAKRMAHSVRRK
jgi:uncharacterized membrane protein YgcG